MRVKKNTTKACKAEETRTNSFYLEMYKTLKSGKIVSKVFGSLKAAFCYQAGSIISTGAAARQTVEDVTFTKDVKTVKNHSLSTPDNTS